MILRRKGGMVEMIPTPQEKREAVVRDHVLELLENLHSRIGRLERSFFVSEDSAREFEQSIEQIRREEREITTIHAGGDGEPETARESTDEKGAV